MLNFDFLEKSLEIISTTICVWFLKKNVSLDILLRDLISLLLIVFTSWDIGQYALQLFVNDVVKL